MVMMSVVSKFFYEKVWGREGEEGEGLILFVGWLVRFG